VFVDGNISFLCYKRKRKGAQDDVKRSKKTSQNFMKTFSAMKVTHQKTLGNSLNL
jgi:hypothetical protein